MLLFPTSIKSRFWKVQVLIVFTSIIDVFGLAAFMPVIAAIANPKLLSTNSFFMALKNMVGITADNYFLLFLFSLALLFFMFRSLFIVYSQYIQNKFVFYVSEYIGQKTYSYYMNMDYQQFQKLDSNFVVRELAVNPEQFVRFVMMPLLLVISELFMMILIVGGIAFYNFNVFVLICTTIFPVAMLFQRVVKKRVSSYGIEKNEQQLKLFNNSNRGVYGYVDAKLLHKERRMIEDFKKVAAIVNGINVKNSTVSIIPAKLFELVTFIGLFIIFLYAFFYSNQPASVIPLIAVYAGAGYRVVPSLSKLVPAFMTIEQYSYLFKTYTEPLKSKDEYPDNDDINRQIVFEKSISLKDIALKFDDEKEVLHDFNFTINKGETIGIIGKSGSGKTTLVKLICGLLKPTSGKIEIDNCVINNQNIRAWMRNISYVQQAPYIEKGTLISNIAFLSDQVDEEKILKCIQAASLADFVNGRNPSEIEILENGKNLSGGQKQRICIARALYNDSQLLIFDEATSALDNETEKEVTEAIKQLKGSGVTVIIIAHRYSTLAYTDRIVELSENHGYKEVTYHSINSFRE